MEPITVTLTGTGSPIPAPGRAGSGVLVRVGDHALQFDAGRATVLRLAEAGIRTDHVSALFLTHHHTDHVVGLPDLLITRWIEGAREPLDVIAPAGPLDRVGERLLDAWAEDIAIREQHTSRPPLPRPTWSSFEPARTPHLVWKSDGCQVSSVAVRHEPVQPAVAYRLDAGGRAVVISGDTRVCHEVEQLAAGADLLIHEIVRIRDLGPGREYVGEYHADSLELGAMASRAGVKRLVLTHLEPAPRDAEHEAAFAEDVRQGGFEGEIVVGRDLTQVVL